MPLEVDAELARLRDMTVPELREEYRRAWGEETRAHNKQHLIKRIVWRLQALAYLGRIDVVLGHPFHFG